MNSTFNCPIIGCQHYPKGTGQKFSDLTHLIRHLKGNDHNKSRHLLDHTLCNKIKLYRCTHQDCRSNPNIFFPSKRALDDHDSHHHTPLCIPIPDTTLYQDNHTLPYDYTHHLFYTPGNENLTNNWNSGIDFILENYNHGNIPHFRSTWRRFLTGNNKTRFYNTMATIINCILHSHTTNNSAAFWWLLLHSEMLILAPTPKQQLDQHSSVKSIIRSRLRDFQCRNIEHLLNQTLINTNWNNNNPRPPECIGNMAAQLAADSDNYRTAMSRACTFNKIATINDANMSIVDKLYPEPVPDQPHSSIHYTNIQDLYLPGDICQTIRNLKWNKGTGLLSDSTDSFIVHTSLSRANPNISLSLLHRHIFILPAQRPKRRKKTTAYRHPYRHQTHHCYSRRQHLER